MSQITDSEGIISTVFPRPCDFDIFKIFDCGQSFRFNMCDKNSCEGVAFGKYIKFIQSENEITAYNCSYEEYNNLWKKFLSIDCDYSSIRADIKHSFHNEIFDKAMSFGNGIRILRQDAWETLCSFIISQNNNIPRIKKIIEAMSSTYGKKIVCGEKCFYTFPTPTDLYNAGIDGLAALKTGFRAKYLYDAACKVIDKTVDFDAVRDADTKSAADMLMKICGVGPKVAACVLLFAFDKTDSFPIDVWIKKVLNKYFDEGFSPLSLGKYAGIAQQYLFYYERYNNASIK